MRASHRRSTINTRSKVQLARQVAVAVVVAVVVAVPGVFLGVHATRAVLPGGSPALAPPLSTEVVAVPCFATGTAGRLADEIVVARDSDRFDVAATVYTQILAHDPASACAAIGLAALATARAESDRPSTWVGRWSRAWSEAVDGWFQPLAVPIGTALGLAVLLAVVARLTTPGIVRPRTESLATDHRASQFGAVVAVPAASVTPVLYELVPSMPPDPRLIVAAVATVGLAAVGSLRAGARLGFRGSRVELRRDLPLAVGLALIVVAAAMLATAGSARWLWVWAVGAGLVGVVCIAVVRGGRLAVQVSVRRADAERNDLSQLLLARLCQLGSEPPRGILGAPHTDVTALPDDALSAVPGGSVAGAVVRLLQLVRPGVPWAFDVVLHDADTVSWQIRRNGVPATTGTTVVSLQTLGITPRDPERTADSVNRDSDDCRLTLAAAALLMTLSKAHPVLQRGLCSATKWETVAWYTLGMAADRQSSVRRSLVQRSVLNEPRFGLARFAEVYLLPTRTPEQRLTFSEELSKLPKHLQLPPLPESGRAEIVVAGDGWQALQLRIVHGIAAAWLNVALLTRPDRSRPRPAIFTTAWIRSAYAALALSELVERLSRHPELSRMSDLLRVPSYYLIAELSRLAEPQVCRPKKLPGALVEQLQTWLEDRTQLDHWSTPVSAYDHLARASYLASEPVDPAFLDHLTRALNTPELARGLTSDPSYATFYGSGGTGLSEDLRRDFKALVARSAGLVSFHDLAPFARWKDALLDAGVDQLTQLAHAAPETISARFGVTPQRAEYWRQIARLARGSLQDPTCSRPSDDLEILGLLINLDITSMRTLRRRVRTAGARETLYGELVTAAQAVPVVPTRKQTIERWRRLF